MRPTIAQDLVDEITREVGRHVRIPADRLTVAERLEVLIEEYERREAELAEAEETIADLRAELEAREERVAELEEHSPATQQAATGQLKDATLGRDR